MDAIFAGLAVAEYVSLSHDVSRRGARLPRFSLPSRLALLVAGTTLPLILFAGVITYQGYEKDREQAATRVVEATRSIRIVLDAELQRMVGGLQVMSLTNALRNGDFGSFRRIAHGFLEQYDGGVLLIADREGRQLFSSVTDDVANLPVRNNQDVVKKVFETGKPVFSDLFKGAVLNKSIVTVEVPVFRDGQVIYDISFSPPLSLFQKIIEAQRLGGAWTISIFDGKGINFARVPNPGETIGQRASPTLYAELFKSDEAKLRTVSLEGVPLITAFTRSGISNWTVAAGIAENTLVRPLWRNLAITASAGILLLLIGVGFAVRMATAIARGEALHVLLVEELNHRVKNTLAIMQAIAGQTFRSASPAERRAFEGRLGALSEAHNLLSDEKWLHAGIRDVVERVLRPYAMHGSKRIRMSGPDAPLSPPQAVTLSMILHEIATNAAKYGALANDSGTIDIEWKTLDQRSARMLQLIWRETGGPKVTVPERKGFGSQLIERGARDQLGGSAVTAYSEDGVTYTIEAALV